MAVTTITQQKLDFTNRDYDSWVLELRATATAAFPSWTDFNKGNLGNLLLELFAHTLDVLSFTQDQQFRETFISFARLRRSMILLARNVGFRLPGATAGTADLEITIADGIARSQDIVVPAGTVVRVLDRSETIEFDTLADITITAGTIQATGSAENARVRQDPYVWDGTANQSVSLAATPFLDGSVSATIAALAWVEVDDFLSSGPTDRHFVVQVDQDDRATLKFGDGINGAIPSGSGTIDYKTGGGSSGNVDANTLVEFRDGATFTDQSGGTVQLTVRNPSGVDDGVDRMSVEEARVAIPQSLTTTGNRSVTRSDFEINARKVRGVGRSLLLTSDDDLSLAENTGELLIVPVGGGLPSAALKSEVETFINDNFPPTLTFTFTVVDPVIKVIAFSATVFLNAGVTEAETRTAIETAYAEFFALRNTDGSENTQIDFGFNLRQLVPAGSPSGELPWSDLFNVMRDAETAAGARVLRKIEEDSFVPIDDVPILDREFPIQGSITLVNGVTGLPF